MRLNLFFPWIAGPLLFGLFALFLGQDGNWDLRNYHLYNPFAYLNNRLGHDILPAGVANFYNPLLHIPFYWTVMSLPPMLTGFLIGAVQGLNFPILVGIARCVMVEGSARPAWHYHLVALIGMLGAGAIAELGTTFGDNLISLPLFFALWLILANFHQLDQGRVVRILLVTGAAGLLSGMAVGLKQPSAIFAVGWCCAFLVAPCAVVRRILLAFSFGLGVLAGIAITGGFWMHEMWIQFGNPLFPYFNDFFRSPMGATASYRDTQFLPGTLTETLFLPFLIFLDPHRVGEIAFRDARFILLIVALAATVVYTFKKAPTRPPFVLHRQKGRFLLAAMIISYLVWLKLFAIYRYLLPLEMLAPLAIWLLIDRFPVRQQIRNMAIFASIAIWLFTLRPGNWTRVPWEEDYFGVNPPVLSDPANSMVIMTGIEPMSYLVPFFPAAVRFIRIESYFTGPSESPNGFDLAMERAIGAHRGPFYVLYRKGDEKGNDRALSHLHLKTVTRQCRPLLPTIEKDKDRPFHLCPVIPVTTSTDEKTEP